jgi:hypothetical protein
MRLQLPKKHINPKIAKQEMTQYSSKKSFLSQGESKGVFSGREKSI